MDFVLALIVLITSFLFVADLVCSCGEALRPLNPLQRFQVKSTNPQQKQNKTTAETKPSTLRGTRGLHFLNPPREQPGKTLRKQTRKRKDTIPKLTTII